VRFLELKNRKYIGLVRCSTQGQADTSLDDQLKVLRSFADEHEMIRVDDVVLPAITGSIPGARTDIDAIIARKNERDDFDTLLIHDSTRLTRAGAQHGNKIRYELAAVGVKIVGAMDYVPENDFADVIHTLQFSAAKQTAKAIAAGSARGSQSALVAGRAAHCRKPPYGIDRLYLAEDGSPSHIIRNLANGEQLKLDPTTGEITARFGRREKSGTPAHYIKQKNERIELVPGDRARVAVVKRIFSRRFCDSWGASGIALELNTEGIPGATGGLWSISVIENILRNPIYRGIGIANRCSSAIYFRRAASAPEVVKVDAQTLAQRKRPPLQIRPSSDWIKREEPRLKEFLDPAIQKLAAVKQQQQLEHQSLGLSPKPNRDRHRESEFILKNILRLPPDQGSLPLAGRRTGPKGKRRRYYAVSRAISCPTNEPLLRRMIPAEAIESAILQMLCDCLLSLPNLRGHVRAAINAEAKERETIPAEIAEITKERESLVRKIEFVVDQLDEIGADALKNKLAQMKARIAAIDARLAECPAIRNKSVSVSEDAIIERLGNLPKQIKLLPAASLRPLLEAFIARAEVNLSTRDVTVELRLPTSLLKENGLCLVEPFASKTGNQAHACNGTPLVKTTMLWLRPLRIYRPLDAAAAA
jgi:hypothetical protein